MSETNKVWCAHIVYEEIATQWAKGRYFGKSGYQIYIRDHTTAEMIPHAIGEDWGICPVEGCGVRRPK